MRRLILVAAIVAAFLLVHAALKIVWRLCVPEFPEGQINIRLRGPAEYDPDAPKGNRFR
jgi:hypothetical protein